MFTNIKNNFFIIVLASIVIAFACWALISNGKAIYDDYTETTIVAEIKDCKSEAEKEDNKETSFITCKRLYDIQKKYQDFPFKLNGHKDAYNDLVNNVRDLLLRSYEQYLNKNKDISDLDIVEEIQKIDDAKNSKDDDRISKLINEIDLKFKSVKIKEIRDARDRLEKMLAKTPDSDNKEPVVAANEDSANPGDAIPDPDHPELDIEWQREIIYTADNVVRVESIKDDLSNVCTLYDKLEELKSINVDDSFINEIKDKELKPFLESIVAKKDINEATITAICNKAMSDDESKTLLDKKLENVPIARLLQTLNGVDKLNNRICDKIKTKIVVNDVNTGVDYLVKYKLQDIFVNKICEDLKTKIEEKFIKPNNYDLKKFGEFKNICDKISNKAASNNPVLKSTQIYQFATEYQKWYNKLSNQNVSFNLEDATARTNFDSGIKIDSFEIENYPDIKYKGSDTFTKDPSSFKSNIDCKTLELAFNQPLTIKVSYYLLDAKPSLRNGFLNLGFVHTTGTAEKVIYPMLKSKWEFKGDELKSGNNGPYITTFTLVIKKPDGKTLEELFNEIFNASGKKTTPSSEEDDN